ncbi:MAG: ferredoxin [Acidimicrobiales bacterium]|nr:MAG: ferredoxin [Acidimicrobiales bacterium]
MKVQLDRDRCQGHGRCYVLASSVFESDDDGYGLVVSDDVPPDRHESARKGAGNCPEDAITIIED